MSKLKNLFSGEFENFKSILYSCLPGYNIFTWRNEPTASCVAVLRIIGYTPISSDYLLHTVHVPEDRLNAETEELVEEFGITFISLSQLLGDWGFTVRPIPEKDKTKQD